MSVLLRLLIPYWPRVILAVGLGAAVVASNMGLLAAAAYLIAAASVTHLMALLVVPMYAVRILSATRGAALGRAMADIEDLQNAYLLSVSPVAVALAVSALATGSLFVFSSAIAWATLGYLVACGVVLPLLVGVLTRKEGRALVTARAELNAHLVDSIQGNRDIVSNGA